MDWPPHFPENCPPQSAIDADGEAYRILKSTSAQPNDFLSHREIYPNKEFELPECQVCGLSIYREKKDVLKMINRVPHFRKQKGSLFVALGNLNEDLGKTKKTPGKEKSHETWWIPMNAKPWTVFQQTLKIADIE